VKAFGCYKGLLLREGLGETISFTQKIHESSCVNGHRVTLASHALPLPKLASQWNKTRERANKLFMCFSQLFAFSAPHLSPPHIHLLPLINEVQMFQSDPEAWAAFPGYLDSWPEIIM
jgi:hypothetical protein